MSPQSRHLLHVFPSFAVGGAQMRFSRLATAHGTHYRHTVIALDHVVEMSERLSKDVQIAFHNIQFDKHRVWGNLRLFRHTVAEIAPDVLVTYNWGAIEWALANRGTRACKHVHIEDGFGSEEAGGQLRRRVWGRRLALSGRQTTVVLPSRGLEQIALRTWKLKRSRVLFIPNGIDCERFSTDVESRRQHGAPLIVGTVATLRREKNIPRLIGAFCAAAASMPKNSVHLLIVGDGPERRALQTLAANTVYADRIEFVGASESPQDWYRKMDVFALSSDTEQMPFSVLEAMASGLPIVATAVGDVRALVAPDNRAQIVPVGDDAEYAAALKALLDNAQLRLRLGRANQQQARKEYDEQRMVQRYNDVFG